MPKFVCGFCESKIRVPDEYIGKRVKCPGCGKPVEVPSPEPVDVGAALDLSLLDDSMSGGEAKAKPRKLRSIVVGCGVCSKTIHIPENRRGAVTPCPKCKTPLLVDVPELPETAGSTIDFKHLALDPASEPSLMGDSLAGGTVSGSAASLTSTGTRPGKGRRGGTMAGSSLGATGSFSAAGASAAPTSSKDQMQELRSLNDLKASGAISDDEYRKRKAAIYSGGGGDVTGARKAMSRNAGGASDRAIRVDTGPNIPGPIKLLAAVGVVALAGFLVWQYGIKPALRDIGDSTTFASEQETPEQQAERAARAEREAQAAREAAEAEAAAKAQAEAEAAAVTWASLIPDLGPEALEVALVQPGRPGPAPDQSVFAMDEDAEDEMDPALAALPSAFDDPPPAPTGGASEDQAGDAPRRGEITFWDVMLPEGRTSHPLARQSTFVYQLNRAGQSAFIGVGIGPAVSGLDDNNFRRWQRNEIQQTLINGLARVPGFESARPRINGREQTANGVTYQEMSFQSADRTGNQQVLLTGVQDGFAVFYWFDGHTRVLNSWKRETLGKVTIE
ncbi:MAG: SHOCT domain-containing protein [Planctomycetota bacterium]